MTSRHDPGSIPAPWVLIDDLTIDQTADLLERLVAWLEGPNAQAAAHCARALSLEETDDPVTISSWAEALAARLRHRVEENLLNPAQLTD